jgi:hypothetical protein
VHTIGDWSNAVVDEVAAGDAVGDAVEDASLAAVMLHRLQAFAHSRGAHYSPCLSQPLMP